MAGAMVAVSRDEPGTVVYDWYVDEAAGIGALYEAYASAEALRAHGSGAVFTKLAPRYAGYPIFDHTMPFNVQRAWDELEGIDHPRIWTAERDRQVWDALQG